VAKYKRLRIINDGEHVFREGEFLEDLAEVFCPKADKRLGIFTRCGHCEHRVGGGYTVLHCGYQ